MSNNVLLDVLMITYNRADYTQRSLSRLFETIDQRVRVWIWHNGSDAETLAVARGFEGHPCFHRLEISEENKKLREPTNWFWRESDAPFISKLDDDCLLSNGWLDTLLDAHQSNPKLGVIGCWRYYDEDFLPDIAARKIKPLNGNHRIFINPWIEGTGYIMKRTLQKELGELVPNESFPSYCIRAAMGGWQIGWYYPFIHQEHMDDPRSPYFWIKTDEEFAEKRPLSAINNGVKTLAEWKTRVQYMSHVVQAASPNPWYYCGWRLTVKNLWKRVKRILGIKESWQKNS